MKAHASKIGKAMRAALFVLLLNVVGLTNAQAQDFTVGDLNYSVYYGGVFLTGHVDGTSVTGSLVIPETVTYEGTTYSVTGIGSGAFQDCIGLTSVIIPNSMIMIGVNAFRGSGLTAVIIPSSVSMIGKNPFADCSALTQIIVDSGNMFYDSRYNCNAIIETSTNILVTGCKNTFIPNSVTSIGELAFSRCTSLTSFFIPDSVTSIGELAFDHCTGLTSVIIPNSVTFIGFGAFSYCSSLTSLNIPNSVTSIGFYAFFKCPLKYITVEEGNTVYDSRENCNAIIETSTNELLVGSSNAFIPNSVTSIGENAFYGCTGLFSVTIPNSVTSIGQYAFGRCSGLISLTIGNSVEVIGSFAFDDCPNISYITVLAENPPALAEYGNTFGSLTTDTPIYVPCGFEDAYASYSWGGFSNFHGLCGGTVNVVADSEEGGTVSGGGTFEAGQTCTVLASPLEGYAFATWTLNGIVVSINAEYTFYVDSDMTIVAHFVPDANIFFADPLVKSICVANWDRNNDGELSYVEAASVKSIGEVFRLNEEIVSFNELQYFIGLSSIGLNRLSNVYCSFDGCSGLTSIILPNSLNSIDDFAFYGCNSLPSLAIGNSVTSIGSHAFFNCSGLTGVYYAGDLSGWCNIFFGGFASNPLYYAHNLYIDNELVTDLVIPETVTRIKQYAFYGATCLKSLTIPNSVTKIDQDAFRNCSNLEYITVFAGTPPTPTFGNSIFFGVNKSIPLYVPCGSAEAYQSAAYWNEFTNIIEMCPSEITASANPSEGGTVTGAGPYDFGTTITMTATANENYIFTNWTENGEVVSTEAEYTFTVTGDRTLVANFVEMTNHYIPQGSAYSETMALYGVIQIDGVEQHSGLLEVGAFCGDECRGSAIASEFEITHRYLAILNIFGESGHQLTFKLYDHGLGEELELTSPAAITFDVDGYGNPIEPYVLNFTSTVAITATLDPTEAGTVTGTGDYAIGDTCTLTATANEGYQFKNWTLNGEVVSTEASYSFTVSEEAAYVAHFHYVHTQALATGWNWWSTYIEQEGIDGLEMLENSIGIAGVRIQGRDGITDQFEYQGTNYWYGSLNAIANEQMYKIRTNADCNAVIVGDLASPSNHPITISNGWNWIGYPCGQSQSLDEVMSGFTPEANDVIKGRNGADRVGARARIYVQVERRRNENFDLPDGTWQCRWQCHKRRRFFHTQHRRLLQQYVGDRRGRNGRR